MDSPVKEYRTIIDDSGNPGYVDRILIGIPVTGLVRIEWVQARFGQMIPVNWSQVELGSSSAAPRFPTAQDKPRVIPKDEDPVATVCEPEKPSPAIPPTSFRP